MYVTVESELTQLFVFLASWAFACSHLGAEDVFLDVGRDAHGQRHLERAHDATAPSHKA